MADTDPQTENPIAALIRMFVPQVQQQQQRQVQSKAESKPGQAQAHEQNYAARQGAMYKNLPQPFIGPPDSAKGDSKMSAGKKAQVKSYQAEPQPGIVQKLQESLLTGGLMGPDQQRQMRIASGQERWTPIVGQTTAQQKQMWKDKRRLAEQQERGLFGQRLNQQKGLLYMGETKLKTGEKLTKGERNALVKAGKLQGPSDDTTAAAIAGTLGVMEPSLAIESAMTPARLGALGARFGRGAASDAEAIGATKAGQAVKPPAGEPIGPKAPRSPASRATAAARKKAADEVNAKTEGPGPAPKAKPKTTPKKPPTSAAEQAAQSSRDTRATSKSTTTSQKAMDKSELLDKLDKSVKADKARITPRRLKLDADRLPANWQAMFVKMTAAEKDAFIKKYRVAK